MTRAATQDERFDHAQDHRKNYIPEPPLSVQTAPLSTAMDIVVLVKAMPNYEDCAALIERYASGLAEQNRLDAVAAGARP